MDHSLYDKRRYPIVDVREGYGEWVRTYEQTVQEEYVHLLSDHAKAAHAAGWSLRALDEGLVDDAWLQQKPKLEAYAGLPISFAMLWRKR